ncbi:MAG TPA: YraN family protein [Eubacteriales bacterium]|nr:YraN family protein [Clostridia bacterium]HRV72310.1 YraN family protein [Eubacteriales bacterium]
MSADTMKIGRQGERLAARYLWWRGYAILERNYRRGHHEIDLIAFHRSSKTLVFVEVKSRTSTEFGLPREYVNKNKQRFVKQAAMAYLGGCPKSYKTIRFDVIEVYMPQGRIEHLQNAF